MSIALGACVVRARLHATLGKPMPTNATSPSLSSAAAAAIIASLVAIGDLAAHRRLRRQPGCEAGEFSQVGCSIRHSENKLVEIVLEGHFITGDGLPFLIEGVVAVVVTLRV